MTTVEVSIQDREMEKRTFAWFETRDNTCGIGGQRSEHQVRFRRKT
jgi:hypothetical protein